MRRTKEEAAITREQLLDAALTVFSSKGYVATTLDDIARAAKVTRGAIYWHFGGKAELYNALVRERFARANTLFEQILAQRETPLETLRRFMVHSLEYLEEDADYRAVLELTIFKTEAVPELAEGMREKQQTNQWMLSSIEDLLRAGVASAEIATNVDVEAAALAIVGLLSGVMTLWLQNPDAFSVKARANAIVHTFLQGLVARS